ncbi:Glycine/D-amino acid oxidase [Cohaesibacter sp. ES.047]|uniref:NAD(P)/FAD-dependent oxidoreductase n=1 Tax=Cohaesibacter sp. ES.047 TaxID=1798205 RepID=UPI000BB77218|nr:FAD-dependent oxidoreductase [Cohaesibacter sp. ES.047]SNY93461.1 Glycine/D-amino acid oxidase [Cohaesibacter sp. ES.047]
MPSPLSPTETASRPDCLIIGGGVFGLSIARACLGAGMRVTLVDKGEIGQGASYGLLGALLPHMSERWNEKKEFQFRALKNLSEVKVALEEEVGISIGYDRCGRVVPLGTENLRERHFVRSKEAETLWHGAETGFYHKVFDDTNLHGWINTDLCPQGYAFDNFSARANPRAYCEAAKASVLKRGGQILENRAVLDIEDLGESASVTLDNGDRLEAGVVVMAAGFRSFPMVEQLTGMQELGKGVKGQALIAKVGQEPGLPILYDRSVYVVPHDGGVCAIGSTSEEHWDDEHSTDHQCDEIWQKALNLCPMLEGAEILTRWAGVRPKASKRDPMVGFLPGSKSLFVATGGFKIGFGIAHAIAEVSRERIAGLAPTLMLPASFEASHHLDGKPWS